MEATIEERITALERTVESLAKGVNIALDYNSSLRKFELTQHEGTVLYETYFRRLNEVYYRVFPERRSDDEAILSQLKDIQTAAARKNGRQDKEG